MPSWPRDVMIVDTFDLIDSTISPQHVSPYAHRFSSTCQLITWWKSLLGPTWAGHRPHVLSGQQTNLAFTPLSSPVDMYAHNGVSWRITTRPKHKTNSSGGPVWCELSSTLYPERCGSTLSVAFRTIPFFVPAQQQVSTQIQCSPEKICGGAAEVWQTLDTLPCAEPRRTFRSRLSPVVDLGIAVAIITNCCNCTLPFVKFVLCWGVSVHHARSSLHWENWGAFKDVEWTLSVREGEGRRKEGDTTLDCSRCSVRSHSDGRRGLYWVDRLGVPPLEQ